jgi:hypothetical protein
MKYIDKKDLENRELTLLPIRRGCGGFCACLGTCMQIAGYVERADYDAFMKTYVSLEDFLKDKCDNGPV